MDYGSEGLRMVNSHIKDTSEVFRRQQKQFDIINLYTRPSEPLRKFPKLTQEHLRLERGMDIVN